MRRRRLLVVFTTIFVIGSVCLVGQMFVWGHVRIRFVGMDYSKTSSHPCLCFSLTPSRTNSTPSATTPSSSASQTTTSARPTLPHYHIKRNSSASQTTTSARPTLPHYHIKRNSSASQTTTRAQPTLSHYYRKRKTRVTPLNFTFSVLGPIGKARNPFIVVLVLTMHKQIDYRHGIRETWGKVAKTRRWMNESLDVGIMLVFLLGTTDNANDTKAIVAENAEYGDIVQATFKESYYNLTYKVLMGFKWVKQYYPAAQYILKVDEDTFIDLKQLVSIIGVDGIQNKVMGAYFRRSSVMRAGKYALSAESFPFNFYPPHVKGNFYIMPSQLAFKILAAAEFMPYVSIEDTHITGILMKVVGGGHVPVLYDKYNPSQRMPHRCDFMSSQTLVLKLVDPPTARDIWKTFLGEIKC